MEVEATSISTKDVEALARTLDRPVVLVGMMGVGKSSVGKRLAAQLKCPFIDADEEIEKSAQMTIPDIFAAYGEDHFRDGERRVIARLIEDDHGLKVIATGGGAFSNEETRALILDKTVSVWLDSDIDTLMERTGRKGNRPLLQQGDRRETLTRLREERRSAYSQAPIHVVSDAGPHGHTVARVLKGIQQWQSSRST